uniref:Ig-like domain-containing protein n=1 Tax=Equus asinus asinus TaxID=83772 RepID=A0A8C4PGZ6_EQUAS
VPVGLGGWLIEWVLPPIPEVTGFLVIKFFLLLNLIFSLCSLVVPCLGKIVWLNLRAWPDPVFEGDTLTLQCQGRRIAAVSRVTFYKDGKSLQFSKDSQTLSVGPATVKNSGRYWCSGQVTYGPFTDMQISRITMVQVQGESPVW